MSMKISRLEIENVKRIKAAVIEPTENGLTIIGGKNRQGKSTVLDAIAWALGGDRYRPSNAKREGSATPPALHVRMSNGLVVERKGKNSALTVTDPSGRKGGQQLLNEFVEQLALDLPKFMAANSKEKATTLLRIIGVEDELMQLEQKEQTAYQRRLEVGRIADQKEKYADEQTFYPDAPNDLVSASELIQAQQEILARNGENQKKRARVADLDMERERLTDKVRGLEEELTRYKDLLAQVMADWTAAHKTADELQDESTAELEASIANIDEINRKVRANLDKQKAEDDAKEYRQQYDALTADIEATRKKKQELLDGAELPLPGLSVENGELTYHGMKWDCLSGAERLMVSTAIVRKLNPECGFVLLDKLEQLDMKTLAEFGEWLEAEGLQAIATRVSTGDECQIIIEDGYAVEPKPAQETKA